MKLTTKALLGGCLLAALIVIGGQVNAHRLKKQELDLVAQCKAKTNPFDQFDRAPITMDDATAKPSYKQAPLICDPYDLVRLGASEGEQGQIVTAHYAAADAMSGPYLLAVIVVVLSSIPWAWYFLLRRIGELRAAIAGNPPAH